MAYDPLTSLIDEERTSAIRRQRDREHGLHHQAQMQASIMGTLIDLGEQAAQLTIHTKSGNTHHGEIGTVGRDFFSLRLRSDAILYCHISNLSSIRPQSNSTHGPALGNRETNVDLLFSELLSLASEEKPLVTIITSGGEQIGGHLYSVGTDVVTIQLHGADPAVCYVSLDSLAELLTRSASK